MPYQSVEEGDVHLPRVAELPAGVMPARAEFSWGDACALDGQQLDGQQLGTFDAVLASNLLCRLPRPRVFLESLRALVKPGGVAVIVSPYSWLSEYTPRK
ncbi:unnamed protein product, partial [Discosporangium mesarthrocarpum]